MDKTKNRYSILFSGVLLPEFDTKRSLFCLLNTLKINKDTVRSIVLSKNKNIISGISADEANYFIDLFQEAGLILYKRKELQPSINTIIINNDQQLNNLHINYINLHKNIVSNNIIQEKSDDNSSNKKETKDDIKEIKTQKSILSRFYQPKIIIGSIFGFVASVIGLIAIFFPSLFNLEARKIDKFVCEIKNGSDALNLYNFMKKHENNIVYLNLTYDPQEELYDRKSGVFIGLGWDEDMSKNFYDGQVQLDGICGWTNVNDPDLTKKLGHKFSEADTDKYIHLDCEKDDHGVCLTKGRYGYSPFGDNGLFSIVSDYDYEMHGDYFYRENGGFGFWDPNIKINDRVPNDLCFQIEIQHSTKENTLYMWGRQSTSEDNTLKESMRGFFFVHPGNILPKQSYMTPKFEKVFQGPIYGERLAAPITFTLDPLTKKEVELKRY